MLSFGQILFAYLVYIEREEVFQPSLVYQFLAVSGANI